MAFGRGDKVEVCLQEEGFRGSYYAATVVSRLPNDLYVVRYDRLLEDHSPAEPLAETVRARDLRPVPPPRSPPADFALLDSVDAFDNDGWWVGLISGPIDGSDGGSYPVFFETTGDEISYPLSRLRPHLDWVRAKWVPPKKSNGKLKRAMIIRERLQRRLSSNNGLSGNVGS